MSLSCMNSLASVLPLLVTVAALGLATISPDLDAARYYVAADGDDGSDGLSPQAPWRTLDRVNSQELEPGDTVCFRRGDTWRGQLRPRSGKPQQPVTYSAYGEGARPTILGSMQLNDRDDWISDGDGIWKTAPPRAIGDQLMPNPGLRDGVQPWSLHYEGGAEAALAHSADEFHKEPGSLRIHCAASGSSLNHIQLYHSSLQVQAGRTYQLSYAIRATQPFDLPAPKLMSPGPPWTSYASRPGGAARVTEQWQQIRHHYVASRTAPVARITFYLGGRLPGGATLFIDDISFRQAEGDFMPVDVGNIIIDGGRECGVKVWEEDQLEETGQYWYDERSRQLKVRCPECPADYYSDIECALRRHIINQSNASWVVYEHLALMYGGAHGIGGGNTHHIIVRDCDFGFIGGGDQHGGDRTVRFGNGVEFWGNAHDNLVERCRLWEVYDAALTNQSMGADVVQADITYRNNLIWNCEYSFEYWNRPETSVTENIRFEHNTCVNAGGGWGHSQRPDPSGRHLCFYTSPAQNRNMSIRNNIFFEATRNAFYAPTWPQQAIQSLVIDNNCWYQADGAMIHAAGKKFTMEQFAAYQQAFRNEPHSIIARPGLLDVTERDFHLRRDSPCIDAGCDTGIERDFGGCPRPHGAAPDIGAYESQN